MHRPEPRRPEPARALALTLVQDLTVIDRIEAALRTAAAGRPRRPQPATLRRLADWAARRR